MSTEIAQEPHRNGDFLRIPQVRRSSAIAYLIVNCVIPGTHCRRRMMRRIGNSNCQLDRCGVPRMGLGCFHHGNSPIRLGLDHHWLGLEYLVGSPHVSGCRCQTKETRGVGIPRTGSRQHCSHLRRRTASSKQSILCLFYTSFRKTNAYAK